MQDLNWKETLAAHKKDLFKGSTKPKPKPQKARQKFSLASRVDAATRNYRRMHPEDLLLVLGTFFEKVSVKRVGGWPNESTPELDLAVAYESIGELSHTLIIKDDHVLLRTDKGFFRFYKVR